MPSPVKSLLPPPSPKAAKAAAPSSDATATEGFQKELTRRTRGDAAPESDQARKAEAKRAAKPKQGQPVGRPRPASNTRSEEPEGQVEPPGEAKAASGTTSEDSAADIEPDDGDSVVVEETAPTESDEQAEATESGVMTIAPLVAAAPAADVAPTLPEADEAIPAALNPAAPDGNARAVVYHPADGLTDADGGGDGEVAEAPDAAAGVAPALFDEAAAKGEPQTPDGESPDTDAQSGRGAPALPADADAESEVSPAFQVQTVAGDHQSKATAAPTDPSNTPTAVADVKPDARPVTHAPAAAPVMPPEVRFASVNHETIVTSMRAELMPNGGTMRIRLDPPQLGAMQVTVQIQDGLVTAAFETSTDEATRLLGHSLNQLKSVLESHGVGVDKLQVQQAPREAQTSRNDSQPDQRGGHPQEQEQSARQEQQRREMLRKMWRRLTGEPDPLDLTA